MTPDELYSWVDHASTVLSVPLALVGFGVTFWQLKKTRTSAQAARQATQDMQQQLKRINIASLLPQLARIEDEIDRAVAIGSVEGLRFWIMTWRWNASEVRTYLAFESPSETKLQRSIQSSISIAADTRDKIHGLSDLASLAAMTTPLRKAVARVTGDLGAISAQQIIASGRDDSDE